MKASRRCDKVPAGQWLWHGEGVVLARFSKVWNKGMQKSSKAAQRETHHCSKLCGVCNCMILLKQESVFFLVSRSHVRGRADVQDRSDHA